MVHPARTVQKRSHHHSATGHGALRVPRHGVEAIAITVIVLFAVILGFIQEFRAERAIEALREMAAPNATVIRDGRDERVPARDLVPGDVIVLSTGDKVPADARLTEAVNLQTVEAALTGESAPVRNIPSASEETTYRRSAKHGVCRHRRYIRPRPRTVVATGMATEFGKIARMLEEVDTAKTPLQKNLDRIGKCWRALRLRRRCHRCARTSFADSLCRDADLWRGAGGGSCA